jgi:hypothetical protein
MHWSLAEDSTGKQRPEIDFAFPVFETRMINAANNVRCPFRRLSKAKHLIELGDAENNRRMRRE